MIVWVAGFHPSVAGGSSGGFEWRYTRRQALVELQIMLGEAEGFHNYVLAAVDVPFEVDPERPRTYDDRESEITTWLDENLHLIELPLQHQPA